MDPFVLDLNVKLILNKCNFKCKSSLDSTNSFSSYEYEKNDKIILKYFQ